MSELLTDKKVEDIDNFSSIKPVTAANLSNTLKIYRNLFITWYEMYGFHFADIEKISYSWNDISFLISNQTICFYTPW